MSVLTTKSLTQTIAILVTSGVSPYLNQTLTALALQTRAPQLTLVVNVEATSASTEDLQALVQASGLTALSHTELINAPEAMNFGQAVARAVELIESGHYRSHVNTNTPLWLWLLHDDSAPQVDCLENLQSATANARSVAMAGPKQVDWDNPGKLLEVGLRVTASARRANEIVPGEIDQGQYDDRVDVLAVGSAGVLVNYHPFIKLGGFSEHFGPFGDGLELSKVMRLAGYRVIVVPEAVIRHRQASYLGLRGVGSNDAAATDASEADSGAKLATDAESADSPGDVDDAQVAETAPDATGAADTSEASDSKTTERAKATTTPNPELSFRQRRIAQLLNWLQVSAVPAPILVWLWILPLGLGRGLARALAGQGQLARDEIASAYWLLSHPRVVHGLRTRLMRNARLPRRALNELYLPASEIRQVNRDQVRQLRQQREREQAPSELESRELAFIARRRLQVFSLLLVLTLGVGGWLLRSVALAGAVSGHFTFGYDYSVREGWQLVTSNWLPSGDGVATWPVSTFIPFALLRTITAPLALTSANLNYVLLVAFLPLSLLGAWVAAGALTRRIALRAWAAAAWVINPLSLTYLMQGRINSALVHLLLPFALATTLRGLGWARREAVAPGTVGSREHDEDATEAEAPETALPLALARPLKRWDVNYHALASAALAWALITCLAPLVGPVVVLMTLLYGLWHHKEWVRLGVLAAPTLVVLIPTIGASLSLLRSGMRGSALALTWGQAGELNGPRRSLYQLLVGTDLSPAGWVLAAFTVLLALALMVIGALSGMRALALARLVLTGWVLALALVVFAHRFGQTPFGLVSFAFALSLAGALVSADVFSRAKRFTLARPGRTITAFSALAILAAGVGGVLSAPQLEVSQSSTQLNAIGLESQRSTTKQRVLYLSSQADQLRVQLWRGDGVQLADVAPASVINAARSYDEANLALLNSVGTLLKGQQSGAVDSLASHGVSLILLQKGQSTAIAADTASALDATPGLERLADTPTAMVWRVNPSHADLSARVHAQGADNTVKAVSASMLTSGAQLPASSASRTLILNERASSHWKASFNGQALTPTKVDKWRQAYVLPSQAGRVEIKYGTSAPLGLALMVFAGLYVLAAVPFRKQS